MEQEIIKLLDPDLECIRCKIKKEQIVFEVHSLKREILCPYCGKLSSKVHSVYQREIQDTPVHDKQTILLVDARKMFCDNSECRYKTFSERFDFVSPNGRKTKRLIDKILMTSAKLSSVSASTLLKSGAVKVSKSSICELLKKMPPIVNKSNITKVCVDDFAFRKRYTYGTVMVDLETHRIIYLLDSRETGKVEEWLKSYPNLQVISRDGAQTYASAAKNSHPEASLRVFMQKERTHQKSAAQMEKETLEYISRKTMCQLIYHELENIKGITSEQYDAVIKKYPILGQLYSLLKKFHRIVFSQKSDELDDCIETAAKLNIDELDSYLGGIHNDIQAVKNAINYKYNNGLAEGSVNKIKLIKRIMYGRNSFTLLKAKILLNESLFYQIN